MHKHLPAVPWRSRGGPRGGPVAVPVAVPVFPTVSPHTACRSQHPGLPLKWGVSASALPELMLDGGFPLSTRKNLPSPKASNPHPLPRRGFRLDSPLPRGSTRGTAPRPSGPRQTDRSRSSSALVRPPGRCCALPGCSPDGWRWRQLPSQPRSSAACAAAPAACAAAEQQSTPGQVPGRRPRTSGTAGRGISGTSPFAATGWIHSGFVADGSTAWHD